ncbi:MAG: hypothetical protein LBT12_01980 [Oscillospiraceae bacterium]|jgi:hypothetical protein|nr:hypothetical protein [Oscillospiraceae bacterium]
MEVKATEYTDAGGEKVIETRYRGREVYQVGGREVIADELMTLDYGKRGVTRVYAIFPDITAAENKKRIDALRAVAGRVHLQNLKNKGAWDAD